jgi:hypothetical protein
MRSRVATRREGPGNKREDYPGAINYLAVTPERPVGG